MMSPALIALSAVFATLCTVSAEEPPMVSIPQVTREQGRRIERSHEFSAEDWAGAARVCLFADVGNGPGIPEQTTALLVCDEANLYAAFVCEDKTMSGRAVARAYGEDLTQDEAVQVVLGLDEGGAGKQIEVGGYKAAQGVALPPVTHYYEFTVNAAGSLSRQYNETLLPRPGFTASIIRGGASWSALLTIPFAKIGLSKAEGVKLYLNLFRFYRAKRYGLHYPSFGNYAPIPFATALLLPAGEEHLKSDIGAKAPARAPTDSGPPAHPLEIEYYPLTQKVCAKFPANATEREAELTIKGTEFRAGARLSKIRSTVVTLELPDAGVEKELAAVAQIRGGAEREERTFSRYAGPMPEWHGTQAGIEYVDRKVAYPWAPPRLEGHTVRLAHADIGFGRSALPSQATVVGRQLLAGPITVEARAEGQALPLADLGEMTAEPTRALADSAALTTGIEARTMVDFDGFMVFRLRTQGVAAAALERLEVRIPLAPGVARYVNRGSVQDTLAIFGAGYCGNASELWVGNENVGLAFSYDRRCFFSEANGRQLEMVQRPDGTGELIIRLVSEKGQVADDEQVFQFFLQGSPFRAEPVPPLQEKTALWFEEWSDHQGYPDLTKIPEVRKRADQAHREGKLQFLYFSQCLAESAPGFADFRSEWVAPPDRPWYRRGYDPGKGVPCYVSCFRGAAGDLLLAGFQRLADEADLDGLYFDGPSYPFNCESIGHDCSDSLPAVWDGGHQTGRILGQRAFLKRARGIFCEKGRKHIIWAHTGGGLNLGTLALCDIFYEGEQLSRYCHGYMIDPARFLVGYSGKPFRFRTFFLPVLYFDAAFDARVAGALGLLHDVETSFGQYEPAAQDLFFSLAQERDRDAIFFGYWTEQPHIEVHGDLPVSYYRGDREAMLVVGNLKYEGKKTVTVDLTRMFAGDIVDVLAYGGRNTLARNCRSLEATVEEGGMRLFRLTPAGVAPDLPPELEPEGKEVAAFEPVTRFDPDDWVLAGSTGSLPEGVDLDLPYLKASVLYSTEVTARFGRPLPRDFTMKMRVAFTTIFRLKIDDAAIAYDGWTPWSLTGFNTLDPLGACVARPRISSSIFPQVKQGEAVYLQIVCRDDRLTVLYDGKFIADRMLPRTIHKSHTVEFATWGGQWMGLDVVAIRSGGEHPVRARIHPVR